MSFHVRDGGVWRYVTAPAVRDGGVWRDVTEGHVRDGGVWRQFFGVFSASVSPSFWNDNYLNSASPVDNGFNSTVTGGVPGYTYAWSLISATGFSFVGGTTSATCTVRATGTDNVLTGTLRLTVTDLATTVVTVDVSLDVIFGTPP